MLNFDRHRCTLCNISIETQKHLTMRNKRNSILQLIHPDIQNGNLSQQNLIYSNFEKNDKTSIVQQLVITVGNYTIYKEKMKKFYNVDTNVSANQIAKNFIDSLKNRITNDHNRMSVIEFKKTWDPGGTNSLLIYTEKEIVMWKV